MSLPQSKAQEILACVCRISPQPVSLGVTHLGFRSYLTGLSISEAITMTFSFFRSDKPVYTTTSFRPISPCQPTQAIARPVLSYLWNPQSDLSRQSSQFLRTPLHRVGAPRCWITVFSTLSERKFHINTSELKVVILALHHWVSVLRGHQLMIATDKHYSCSLYQQTGWDPFPYPVTSSSGSVPMATNSRHSQPGPDTFQAV